MYKGKRHGIERRRSIRNWAGRAFRGGLLVWAVGLGGLSALFGIAEASDGWMNLASHLAITLIIAVLAISAWLWPRWGGLLLAAVGLWGIWFFDHPFADYALATPAVVIGVIGMLIDGAGPSRRQLTTA